jgi:hypothetical protein
MKRSLLFAVSIVFGLSCHSVMASTNLVQNSGFESGTDDWHFVQGTFTITAANGPSASGTASALLGGGSTTSQGEITQQIATIPGTSYVVQFDYKTLDTNSADDQRYSQIDVSDTNGDILLNLIGQLGSGEPTTTFQTAVGAFTAIGDSVTIDLTGYDEAVVDNVIVTTGTYSEPGKYTGSVKVTGTIPSQSVGSFHTESVVAQISPSGGITLIEQPSGTIESGAFQSENTLAISGTTTTVTVKDKTDIKFTGTTNSIIDVSDQIPVTDIESFSLKRVGK